MNRNRFTEEQILGILKDHQTGIGAKDFCREHSVSDVTFYKWQSKYGGTEVSDAQEPKEVSGAPPPPS